ncbi:disease resistance protein RGA2-like [Quercus lobata]|nr:disease resistance protein RGA2-like [Quercus lobata]
MEGEDNQYLKLSLQNLIISSLPKLEVFPQQLQGSANTLRQLLIQECENLIALPKWLPRLKSLQTLMIDNCPKLSSLSEVRKGPTSLRKFIITRLSKLEVLPQWLQGSANTLQLLGIGHCENLKALPEWLPCLKSLHTLRIVECPKLSSLPEGMEALTTLRLLKIRGCPNLSRKCREEDSHKIAHVQQIYLEGTWFTKEMKMASASTS